MNESATSTTVQTKDRPRGQLAIRLVAMPADLNAGGHVFGGWILSQMDLAGGICASERAQGRVATIAITAMEFHHPVHAGDVLSCWGEVTKVGNTSLTVHVQAWSRRHDGPRLVDLKVTEGDFVFVALTDAGVKRSVPADQERNQECSPHPTDHP
ncbi:MAG: acyl-CoA thioesterase [Alphaproteobacteria bacterium]|nr:acyl-CoA thioesterase [Alphaproteobacteria bacterium]